MNYWLADNLDRAENSTLHMLIGALQAWDEFGKHITPQDVLEYIEKTTQAQEQWYDEHFPDKARRKAETA